MKQINMVMFVEGTEKTCLRQWESSGIRSSNIKTLKAGDETIAKELATL